MECFLSKFHELVVGRLGATIAAVALLVIAVLYSMIHPYSLEASADISWQRVTNDRANIAEGQLGADRTEVDNSEYGALYGVQDCARFPSSIIGAIVTASCI